MDNYMNKVYAYGFIVSALAGSFCIIFCGTKIKSTDITPKGCRDQTGLPVDSFILYKLPQDHKSPNSLIQQGLGYMYLTPDTPYSDATGNWVLSNQSIGHNESLPGYTLDDLYNQREHMKDNALYIFYNDEFPNGTTSESHGHTKGVVVMTNEGGYWLVHSTPRYPPSPLPEQEQLVNNSSEEFSEGFKNDTEEVPKSEDNDEEGDDEDKSSSYDYPSTGTRYGQTFMCLSLPPDQADNLGWQLMQNKPYIYAANVADELKGKFPVLERVVAGRSPSPDSAQFRVTQIATRGHNVFTSFAKHTKFGKDLYSGLVAPNLEAGLLVESWRNGPHPLPSECNATQYKVNNIESVSVGVSGTNFTTHHDHSKWAVSVNSSRPFVCVGDINRMQTQFHRAGGTVCVKSRTIWKSFVRIVSTIEKCPLKQL